MTDTSYTTMDPGPKVEDPARPSDPYSPFLALPREIRNMIYTHALTYPSFNRDYQSMRNVPLPPLTTPTILLLNHQITSEALASLHRAPLVIDAAPPSSMGNNLKWIEITDLISYRTLQAVPRVTLAMDLNFQPARKDRFDNALSWANTVEILLDIWGFKHRLEELVVKVDYVPPSKRAGWTFAQAGHHQCVVGLLSKLAKLSSEVPVTFEGDLEVDPWKVPGFPNPYHQNHHESSTNTTTTTSTTTNIPSSSANAIANFMSLQAPTGSGSSKLVD